MIEAIAWKNLVNETHFYCLQFVSGSTKEVDLIFDTLKDWKQSGFGHTKKGETYIFKKEFEDTKDWLEWVKHTPFVVKELDKEGNKVKLKTSVKEPKSVPVKAKFSNKKLRKCGKCGMMTYHNARTCSGSDVKCDLETYVEERDKRSPGFKKLVEKEKKNICSVCGQLGHNKRTCKTKG